MSRIIMVSEYSVNHEILDDSDSEKSESPYLSFPNSKSEDESENDFLSNSDSDQEDEYL